MTPEWEDNALADLGRIHDFAAARSLEMAERTLQMLTRAPKQIMEHPRIGSRGPKYAPREVRRWLIGMYEMHYEVREEGIVILRVWSVREDR